MNGLPEGWRDNPAPVKLGFYGKTLPCDWRDFRDVIAARHAFNAGSMKGRNRFFYPPGHGQLPPEYWQHLNGADYVIWSYDTPVAWHNPEEGYWWVPDVIYSHVTSAHQWLVRMATGHLPGVLGEREEIITSA